MCFNNVALIPIRTKNDNYYAKVFKKMLCLKKVLCLKESTPHKIFGIIFRMIKILKAHSHQE